MFAWRNVERIAYLRRMLALSIAIGLLFAQSPAPKTSPRQVVAVGSVADLDAKDGFRDVVFGTNVADIKGMKLQHQGKTLAIYSRATDSMRLGAADLEAIGYGVVDGRVVAVFIDAEGENCGALLDALRVAYGSGTQANPYIPKYEWNGARVQMTFERNDIRKTATVQIVSRAGLKRDEEMRDQAAKNADL